MTINDPAYTYEVTPGTGLSMSSLGVIHYFKVKVVAADGEVAAWKDFNNERSAKMWGGKYRKAYQGYFERTGQRFELERKAKKEHAKKLKRISNLERDIPILQAELEKLRLETKEKS